MRTEIYADEHGGIRIRLVVSRRNLRVLLAKLDRHPAGSACSIVGPNVYVPTMITAEEDDVHYAHPSRMELEAGLTHPDTETALDDFLAGGI